jgi:ADP-ribose pyrophosphatase YjhB (NUDIX family)
MSIAQKLAYWADWLREISATGLFFAANIYDEGHFRAVQSIAMEMMAAATDETLEDMEPLRATVFTHRTPFSVVDAAVIDSAGRILLIRRSDNHLWAMPGGACEVGETPAQGAVRETLEETGVHCRPTALIGVHDSRLCGTVSRHHLYQLLFLCEPLDVSRLGHGSYAHEVIDVAWFTQDALPAQDEIDPGHRTRIPEAYRVWQGDPRAFFDAA